MEKIENVQHPIIGKEYLVKCIRSKREYVIGEIRFWCPVFGESHHDKELYLTEKHYHIDWRFLPKIYLNEQEGYHRAMGWFKQFNNTYFFSPIMEYEIKETDYLPFTYLRHFGEFPEHSFDELVEKYKNVRMHDMICPHKKANLRSCEVIDNVVTCPCHGLKWNVKTGSLEN